MPVKNIECQIAQAQLGRYLAGEGMAGEAVRQLEIHLGKCTGCKQVLDAKRQALLKTLEETSTQAHPAHPETSRKSNAKPVKPSRLGEALMAKAAVTTSAAPAAEQPSAKRPTPNALLNNWKPLAYAAALGALLIGMSYLGKTDLLGTRASAALPAADTRSVTANATHRSGGLRSVATTTKAQPHGGLRSLATEMPADTTENAATSDLTRKIETSAIAGGETSGTRLASAQKPSATSTEDVAPSIQTSNAQRPIKRRLHVNVPHRLLRRNTATPQHRTAGIHVYNPDGTPIAH